MIRMRPSKQKRKPARLTSMRAAPKPCATCAKIRAAARSVVGAMVGRKR